MAVTSGQLQSALGYPKARTDALGSSSGKMGKNAFLQLFVAQLQNQNPLSPMDNKDSTAQLAQFSSLEQLTNLNTALGNIAKQLSLSQTSGASALIGKSVLADGNQLSKEGDTVSKVNLNITKKMANVTVNIHDEDGNIIRTVKLGDLKSGKHEFAWDGKDTDGNKAPDGIYKISVVAEDADGKKYLVKTQVEGKVKAVVMENGKQMLELKDGRKVAYSSVWKIYSGSTN